VSHQRDSDTWTWLDKPSTKALANAGAVTLELLCQAHRWVNRRVDRISFHDADTAHQQVSIDFSLPPDLSPVGERNGEHVYVVPLALLAKRTQPLFDSKGRPMRQALYSHMEVTDQDGSHLPRVTGRQSAHVAGAVLTAFAKELFSKESVTELDKSIAYMTAGGATARAEALRQVFGEGSDIKKTLAGQCTGEQFDDFRELAYTLAHNWMILTVFVGDVPGRSVVTLTYHRPLERNRQSLEEGLRRGLGWKSKLYEVPLNEIGAAATYHVEVDVPPELELTQVALVGERYQFAFDPSRASVRFPRIAKILRVMLRLPAPIAEAGTFEIRQRELTGAGQLYIPRPAGRRVGVAWVKLRVRRQGFLIGALLASVITSAVLIAYTCRAEDIVMAKTSESAVALLLLVPTLIATYVARPGEHSVTARMLRWARVALVANGALPFIAAVRLVTVNLDDSAAVQLLKGTWEPLVKISLVFVVLFVMSNLLPRPHGKRVYSVTHVERELLHPSGDPKA
jgi:hypothetical protein